MRRLASPLAAVTVLAASTMLAGALPAGAEFPQDPPNDPEYAPAEQPGSTQCIDDEQWVLYDFIPRCTPLASDPEGAAGLSVNRAWRQTTGDPTTLIAYVEGGINWHLPEARDLTNKVYINTGELPLPERADGSTCPRYDCDGNGVVNVEDYAHDPRIRKPYVNGFLTPEDLIVAFGHCQIVDHRIGPEGCPPNGSFDNDHNGYPNDVSGWDFYNNQNDPATTDAAYEHPDGQMRKAAAQTNNALLGAGACPRCMLLPIKAGAEALDRGPDLAQAWLFAVDSGAQVIISETAELGYSTFVRRAAEYAYRAGTVIVESSNDFNSIDHQGGMYHPHVLPGNGLVPDQEGTQQGTRLTRTFRERSSMTSWGEHNVFSVPSQGGSTSAADPMLAALVGLVVSYGRSLSPPLSAPEAVQVLRATSSPISDPSLSWPGKPGWNLQYGYGRPNVVRALDAVSADQIPPVAAIERPDWFALYDPTRDGPRIPVEGWIRAPRTPSFQWRLELGLGAEPTDAEFHTIGSGSGRGSFSGRLGTIDLRSVPRSLWARPFALSHTKELETAFQYTVTLRLQVTDAQGRVGEDRRAIYVQHDPSAYPGFPRRIDAGAGGESQPALADLQGRGRLAIIFATSDGIVHAIDPQTGRDLPGWPVHTAPIRPQREHPGVPSGYEPVLGNVAVGSLEGNGALDVVATSVYGRVYVWDDYGHLRRGFPKTLASGVVRPPIPRPAWPYRRYPTIGAVASPVLGDLDGNGQLEIIQAAWDGHIHVLRPDGHELQGWPVKVALPTGYQPESGYQLINDEKLDATPALAKLDASGHLAIVERSQQTEIQPQIPGGVFGARGHVFAFAADGKPVNGWPVRVQGLAEVYGTAQEFVTEGSGSPVAADVDGTGRDHVAVDTVLSPGYLYHPDGSVHTIYSPLSASETTLLTRGLVSRDASVFAQLPDMPVNFTTSAAFGHFDGTLTLAQPQSSLTSILGAVAFPGQGLAIKNYESAWDASTGTPKQGFPALRQGLDFIGAPLFVDVTGDGQSELIDGGDSNALHAYESGGGQAPGFPKFTVGWNVYSPTAGDLDSDGDLELVMLTREGSLYVWRTQGHAADNNEWWRWHHDEWNTGRYGTETRPPLVPRNIRRVGATHICWIAPGDHWAVGTAARYELRSFAVRPTPNRFARGRALPVPRPSPAGTHQCAQVPVATRWVALRAISREGLVGYPAVLDLTVAAPSGTVTTRPGGAAGRTTPATGMESALVPGLAFAAAALGLRRVRRRAGQRRS